MANNLGVNPWKIDTPGAGVIYAFPIRIGTITWANYTPGTAQALVQDANGNDILNAAIPSGQTQMQPVVMSGVGWVRGLKVPTLTNGELTITIGAGK